MPQAVMYERDGEVAVVTISNPPVNALSAAVRQGLDAAMRTFAGDAEAKAAILVAEGRTFMAGADIAEFGKPPVPPLLTDLCTAIENAPKPVIASMHGTPLGGGLEVAMACHWRIARTGTRVGLPEVHLGIIPGAGGTQRLPRLAGVAAAIDIITTGRQVPVEEALALGIVDEIDDGGDARAAGLRLARAVLASNRGVRRTGEMVVQADPEVFAAARAAVKKTSRGQKSPMTCIDAIAASILPIEEGLGRERALFRELYDDPQRAALVHAFFGERAVARVPEAGANPRPIDVIGVIGGGAMGAGIAAGCLASGLKVVMIERDEESLARAEAGLRRNFASAIDKGRMSRERLDALMAGNWTGATALDALADVDVVIEAVFETMAVKKDVFGRIDRVVKPGAVLASNTSMLNIDEIAACTSRPQDVIGLHFFSPAHIMRLLEIVVGAKSAPDAVSTGFALARRMKKVGVRAGVCDGFIGNRILGAYMTACNMMVEDGASPYDIDAAVREFGMAMGPFQMRDLAGLDIGYLSRQDRAADRNPEDRYAASFLDRIYLRGWLGQKSGKGFYDYSANPRSGPPNAEVEPLIAEERRKLGINARSFTREEILRRYIAAMTNEAAKVVGEGIALRPVDVDMAFLFGYGYPRWRGGPMHQADASGLDRILADIREFARDDPRFWKPAPLLVELVETGRSFEELNDA